MTACTVSANVGARPLLLTASMLTREPASVHRIRLLQLHELLRQAIVLRAAVPAGDRYPVASARSTISDVKDAVIAHALPVDTLPSPPPVPREHIEALIAYASACAGWLEEDHRLARERGHTPDGQTLLNLEGYRFTALFLTETYELL